MTDVGHGYVKKRATVRCRIHGYVQKKVIFRNVGYSYGQKRAIVRDVICKILLRTNGNIQRCRTRLLAIFKDVGYG